MRRKDREITDFNELVDIIDRCDTVRIGLCGDDGQPYIVPMSFGYEVIGGRVVIYVHGAREGLKNDIIAQNSKVCVEADICHGFVNTGHSITTNYESIVGFGRIKPLEGEQAVHALDKLLEHCGYGGYSFDLRVMRVLTAFAVELETVTGKRRFPTEQ